VPLASGYPLHHLRAVISFRRFGGSAAIPLATRTRGASALCATGRLKTYSSNKKNVAFFCIYYLYFIFTKSRDSINIFAQSFLSRVAARQQSYILCIFARRTYLVNVYKVKPTK